VSPDPETSTDIAVMSADPRPRFERAADQLSALIASVPADRLDDPTPCADFDVRALLAHIVQSTGDFADIGEGRPVGATEPGEQGAPGRPSESVPDDGWAAAYERARARVSAAWKDDARLDEIVSVPWGDVPGRGALGGGVMETVAHTWDLARALGRSCAAYDPEPVAYALAVAHGFLPADGRGPEVPFGPVQQAPEGADDFGRLAAWLGRGADWAG
jgi:uncharacterized protein (TIGR03086 family)